MGAQNNHLIKAVLLSTQKLREYDQVIPQSPTAYQPPRHHEKTT